MKLSAIEKQLLETVANLHKEPRGALNIRRDGKGIERISSANIQIETKKEKPGINVIVAPGTKNESVHIPVLITLSGITDVVYNTIEIGEGADVLVVAGCGIHNPGQKKSQHDGIHEIIVRKGAKMRYVEKHYAQGEGAGEKVLNPTTVLVMEEDSIVEMEMAQIKGIDNTIRDTKATLGKRASLVITERLMTHGNQEAVSDMNIILEGKDSNAQIISRSVASGNSKQVFRPNIIARASAIGHVECDSIIMDNGSISSMPAITAENPDAQLTHEAAIGKIAQEQIIKLRTLGLTEQEAENVILKGFLN